MGGGIRPAEFVCRGRVCYLEGCGRGCSFTVTSTSTSGSYIWLLFRLMPSLYLFKVSTLRFSQRGSHDAAQASNSDKSDVDSLKVFIRLMISFVI